MLTVLTDNHIPVMTSPSNGSNKKAYICNDCSSISNQQVHTYGTCYLCSKTKVISMVIDRDVISKDIFKV